LFYRQYKNVSSDPLYNAQEWVYDMINVVPVWQSGIFGTGVHVRVNDEGVDFDHSEFLGRVDVENSCDEFLPQTTANQHGTSVSSIMAAAGDNDECAVGISPGVIISS
jgi:subtilisin family serine protease